MTIEDGIFAFLTSTDTSATASIIGDRLYPFKLPQDPKLEAMTFKRVSGRDVMTHGGPVGLPKGRYQFDCYAATYKNAKALAKTLRADLDGHKGTMGDVTVTHVFWLNEIDDWGDVAGQWRITVDFEFQWKE